MEMEPQYMVSLAIDKLKLRYDSYNEQQKPLKKSFLCVDHLKCKNEEIHNLLCVCGTCDII